MLSGGGAPRLVKLTERGVSDPQAARPGVDGEIKNGEDPEEKIGHGQTAMAIIQ